MTRTVALAAAALGVIGTLASCSGSGRSSPSTIPAVQVSQRYSAAVAPANAALAALFSQVVAFTGGPPGGLDAAARRSELVVKDASGQLGRIAAPTALRGDIEDVSRALDAVDADLSALVGAGSDLQSTIVRLVADIGRESAADGLAKLALTTATTPTSLLPVTVPPATDTTVANTTTTVARTTTVPRPTTTRRPTTTVLRTTTTKKL